MGCCILTDFYLRFLEKCNEVNKKPSAVVVALGLSKSAVTRWKAGNLPTDATVKKIADYFGVASEWMLGKEKDAHEVDHERYFANFARLCREKGVTESEALQACGFSPEASAKWASEKNLPMAARALLARYFGVAMDEFRVPGKEEQPGAVAGLFSPLDSRWFSLTEEEKLQAWEFIVQLRAKKQGGDGE